MRTAQTNPVALVTGATHGIGYEVARRLLDTGATVIVHGRTRAEAQQAAAQMVSSGTDPLLVKVAVADFARLSAVSSMAERIRATHRRIDLLVNSAAMVGGRQRRLTWDAHEVTFQVNYLAPYLLTRLLWPSLRAAARPRVVNLSSTLHRRGVLHWPDLALTDGYTAVSAYAQSKLALTMSTRGLAEYLPGTVTALSLHPGVIATGPLRTLYGRFGAPVEDGAEAVLHLCDPATEVSDGGYYEGWLPAKPASLVLDRGSVGRLWRLTQRLTDLPEPFASAAVAHVSPRATDQVEAPQQEAARPHEEG